MSLREQILSAVDKVRQQFSEDTQHIETSLTETVVEQLRIQYMGRKGQVTALMDQLKESAKEDRPVLGKAINELRQSVESALSTWAEKACSASLQARLAANTIDVSLPVDTSHLQGALHPVSLVRRDLGRIFRHMGFTVVDGPEVELDYYNFSALNFKDDHPARDMQDTFFVRNFGQSILRTHTSNIQVHAMLDHRPPLRVVAMGRTYRVDSDATHTPMFHQIEGFIVDRNINMSHMKGVIEHFLSEIFGGTRKVRLRPSYFPFVEPGAEFDMLWETIKHPDGTEEEKWLELGGLGMIHPNVLEAVSLDSETYTGFAFGFGIDRIAMLRYGLNDLRQLFDGNQAFLGQFPINP